MHKLTHYIHCKVYSQVCVRYYCPPARSVPCWIWKGFPLLAWSCLFILVWVRIGFHFPVSYDRLQENRLLPVMLKLAPFELIFLKHNSTSTSSFYIFFFRFFLVSCTVLEHVIFIQVIRARTPILPIGQYVPTNTLCVWGGWYHKHKPRHKQYLYFISW